MIRSMKLKNIYSIMAAIALPLLGVGGLTSCSEADSELVSFVEDNRLNTPNDTLYALMGIIGKMQKVADRTILLGELRGDLTSLTDQATLDLQDIAGFKADASNPYNNARDYYAIIQNCNYFLANADTELTKRGYKVFEKEYAVVKAYRAWTYLQLAINYGSVPFFTEPILAEKDADPSKYEHRDVKWIANYFIDDLEPYKDIAYPDYGSINSFNSRQFYIPIYVLLGDLCLWAERYEEAAKFYHDYLTKQGNTRPLGASTISWHLDGPVFDRVIDDYANLFTSSSSSQVLTLIPMETEEYNGVVSDLQDVFASTRDNNYYYQATRSAAYEEISRSQTYTALFTDPVTLLRDTLYMSPDTVLENEAQRGDLRMSSIYPALTTTKTSDPYLSMSGNFSKLSQNCRKYAQSHAPVVIYRLTHVYLRYAEALNRAGYPQAAFAVLKYGLWKDNIEKYISEEERAAAGELISFSEYTFTRENTVGLHSRGCGNVECDSTYTIPELSTKADSILFVEDKICDEMALETAAEGFRFYDLMRLAKHRNDPSFLADKVARRKGTKDEKLFQFLKEKKNWYLPLE